MVANKAGTFHIVISIAVYTSPTVNHVRNIQTTRTNLMWSAKLAN